MRRNPLSVTGVPYPLPVLMLAFLALDLRAADRNASSSDAKPPICVRCLKIRVGVPSIVQGPAPNIVDNPFSEIRLADGRFRGFTANVDTYAVDGRNPLDMHGPLRKVLGPGSRGDYGDSGRWINHVERSGSILLGWVHDETGDATGQGLKSMSLATSKDEGLSWEDRGQIITGKGAAVRPGKVTGEADCTAVDGQDGYYYAYCYRNENPAQIVARAPVSDPGPGKWTKFFQGKWDQPGLGGDATGLAKGTDGNVARWLTTGEILLLGWTRGGMGLHLSVTPNTFTAFTDLPEPLLDVDPGAWARPAASELIAYADLLDAKTGSNQLSDSWILAYMYIQPNESFNQRYLVMRNIEVSMSKTPVSPQVGVLLARWYNATLHDRWSTTAAVPPVDASAYRLEATLGYLMTAPAANKPTIELDDCVSQWPGHPDHLLDAKGACEADPYHFQRLRTAGWVYRDPQEQTVPLYRCYGAQERSHFASNEKGCEDLGKMERLLGYALSP
jgi:hypothetical protein